MSQQVRPGPHHRIFLSFLSCIKEQTRLEFIRQKSRNEDVPDFHEFEVADGQEPLKKIWNNLPDFAEKGKNEIQKYLSESWKDKFPEDNSKLIANAIWSCILLHGDRRDDLESEVSKDRRFPSPPGLQWGEVSWVFTSDETVKIRARGITKKFHFAEIGFKDGRGSDHANILWGILKKAFAHNYGEIDYQTKGLDPKIQNQIKEHVYKIRKKLKEIFGIEEDPFESYKKTRSYKLKLSIRDESFTSTLTNLPGIKIIPLYSLLVPLNQLLKNLPYLA